MKKTKNINIRKMIKFNKSKKDNLSKINSKLKV